MNDKPKPKAPDALWTDLIYVTVCIKNRNGDAWEFLKSEVAGIGAATGSDFEFARGRIGVKGLGLIFVEETPEELRQQMKGGH